VVWWSQIGVMKIRIVLAVAAFLSVLISTSCSSSSDTRPADGVIDKPQNNAVLHSSELFAGWAAQPSGIESVAIYADGQFVVNAAVSGSRPDVVKALPQYQASMVSGWNAAVDTSHMTVGPHVFTAKIKTKSGVEKDLVVRASVAR